MQELIIHILLAVIAVMAVGLLIWGQAKNNNMTKKQKKMLGRILAATVLLLILQLVPGTVFSPLDVLVPGLGYWVRLALYLVDYLIIGYDILIKALKGIKNRQIFDESFLMAIATVGAIALALYEQSGDYTEAIAVMLFYQIGEWFQSYAVGKSRPEYQRFDGYPPGLRQCGTGRETGTG